MKPALQLVLVLAGFALLACGEDDDGGSKYPPVAEPAEAPEPTREPAGRVFSVGAMPEGLTVDPASGLIAIGLREPNLLEIFDPSRGRVVRKVPLSSAPRHLDFDEADRSVLVPAEQTDELIRVPLPRGEPVRVAVGDHPHDAAAAPNGRIFVGDEFGDTISVVRDDELEQTLDTDEQPGGVEEAGPYVAVVAVAQRTLSVFDSRSLRKLASIPAGVGPTHIQTLGRRAFVADTDGDAIIEYRIGPDPKQVRSTPLEGAPYGIALDRRRLRLWVTQTALNTVAEYEITPGGLRKLATYPTVRQPNTVVVEPISGDAYVASRTDGELQRITPSRD